MPRLAPATLAPLADTVERKTPTWRAGSRATGTSIRALGKNFAASFARSSGSEAADQASGEADAGETSTSGNSLAPAVVADRSPASPSAELRRIQVPSTPSDAAAATFRPEAQLAEHVVPPSLPALTGRDRPLHAPVAAATSMPRCDAEVFPRQGVSPCQGCVRLAAQLKTKNEWNAELLGKLWDEPVPHPVPDTTDGSTQARLPCQICHDAPPQLPTDDAAEQAVKLRAAQQQLKRVEDDSLSLTSALESSEQERLTMMKELDTLNARNGALADELVEGSAQLMRVREQLALRSGQYARSQQRVELVRIYVSMKFQFEIDELLISLPNAAGTTVRGATAATAPTPTAGSRESGNGAAA